jgi:hypothetical protein
MSTLENIKEENPYNNNNNHNNSEVNISYNDNNNNDEYIIYNLENNNINNTDNNNNEINFNTYSIISNNNNITHNQNHISNQIENSSYITTQIQMENNEKIPKYEKKLICPISKIEINPNKITEVKILTQKINNFIIYCENKSQNCKWKGALKDREPHIQICDRAIIYCKNTNCKVFNFREEIIIHEYTCNFRKEKCKHCSIDYLASEKEKHQEKCEFLKLPCRNFCGEMIERKFINIHLENNCGNSLINCPLQKYNLCNEKLLRNNLKFHFEDKIHEHLLKFAEGFLKMEQIFQNKILILKENNKNLLNSNKTLIEELDILKENNKNLLNNQNDFEYKLIENFNIINKLEEKFINFELKFNNYDNYIANNNNNDINYNKICENLEIFDNKNFDVNKRLDILEEKFKEEIIKQNLFNKNLNILSIKNFADNNNNNSYNTNENFFLGNKRKNSNDSNNNKENIIINDSINNNKENILNFSSSLNDTENSISNFLTNDNKENNIKNKLKNKKDNIKDKKKD